MTIYSSLLELEPCHGYSHQVSGG